MTWSAAAIVPVLAGAGMTTLQAQGGFPTYPYCAQYSDGTSLDCSFSTLSMCYQSVTGVGGVCIDNPRAGGVAPAANSQFAFGPSAVPPPPVAPASGPIQLPGVSPSPPSLPPPPCNPLIDGTYCASAAAAGIAPVQSLSSDLAIGNPPATLGAINFSGNGSTCIGLLRWGSCGG
jgi:hypothetical protein